MNELLQEKLEALKLSTFVKLLPKAIASYQVAAATAHSMLEELCDGQLTQNELAAQQRHRKAAKLRWPYASTSNIDFIRQKTLSKKEVMRLSEGNWVNEGAHLMLLGPTGTAKTTIACAIANALIAKGIKVLFIKFHDLLLELKAADSLNDRRAYSRLTRKFVKVPVLAVDDWAITPMSETQRRLLFDLVETRDGNGSLIITSQYKPSEWHGAFGDSTIADAVLDRIVHSANIYDFEKVESYRKLNAQKGDK